MVEFDDRLDEAHKAVLEMIPEALLDLSDLPTAREMAAGFMAAMAAQAPDVPGVEVEDHWAPGADGDPDVMVRVYTPSGLDAGAPALYWIHGGGMVMGDVAINDADCKGWAVDMGCVVASVEYRLAPEHPHPAPIEDCFAGLKWLVSNAESLGVDAGRIAVGGASAGGGLAAALALVARDRGVDIIFQQLICPMLDDRNITRSSHWVHHPKVWNRAANIIGWSSLLGKPAGSDDVSPYASPARAEDLAGLAPAFIIVGDLDLFVDESIEYTRRLAAAGVPTELHILPGAVHGSQYFLPTAEVSMRWKAIEADALRVALHGSG
ncbi:MAG: alpha/beta hydrolase [bacterium]|nr:alpha/beta hydrolase [bacterium]